MGEGKRGGWEWGAGVGNANELDRGQFNGKINQSQRGIRIREEKISDDKNI